ncbi:flippase-like domain-containing protein [Mucilaginibacter sp. HMF5004]|uniref:lysylphosphatidylglycerol synthase domain-containing protein n=1 Tax=Mucilaginibacter rivuli TaxID=2857527 RepID=UPI001C5FE77D|nr:lysylphosphatidylglycerol synthase domain-containing protein [Mucilaginibacter rivuli]MBW4891762.1 flippase-like domain-containing protein [Mucilaginibacter rivuli]
MTASTKKYLSLSIKVAIIAIAYWFIYRSVSNKGELSQFKNLLNNVSRDKVIATLSAVCVLMLINWVLEAIKWKYLTRRLQRMSLWRSIEAVFCGLTWAIFTPNRLGEYGGRVLFLPPSKRGYGIFTMAIGSFGQNVVTNVVGATALISFAFVYLHLNAGVYVLLTLLAAALAAAFIICFFNIRWLAILLNKVKFLHKYERFFNIIQKYKTRELATVMLYCVSRFAVFSSEYYLVIHMLLPELPAVPMLIMVFNMFFIQSALPTLDVIDVGLRGMTAATFFSYITTQKIAVIACVSSIWFINLIVPAIVGSIFVLKLRFFDRNA